MIEYNENDFNMDRIDAINFKMNGYKMAHPYWVYGLQQKSRPPVRVGVNDKGAPNEAQQKELIEFFKTQDIELAIDQPEEAEITIGLRRDLRDDPRFAAAIVRTVIFFIEGKMTLNKEFKITSPLKKGNK
jgi:hypothetical protein